MRIYSILLRNFGPFVSLEKTQLGQMATIVGQNDVGKSSILRALDFFFASNPKLEAEDFNDQAGDESSIVIEVEFSDLPKTIELEEGVETTLGEEHLVNSRGFLHVRKAFPKNNPKPNISLLVHDFADDDLAGLALRKESELNRLCQSHNLDATRSGRGVTNKGKRDGLRQKAEQDKVQMIDRELPLSSTHDVWKAIKSVLPQFESKAGHIPRGLPRLR